MKAKWRQITRAIQQGARLERDTFPWVILALSLALLPNLVFSIVPAWDKDGLHSFFHLIFLVMVPCFLGLCMRKLLWVLWPLVWGGPIVLACRFVTGQMPSEWFFLVIAETNPREASAFTPQITTTILAMIALGLGYAFIVLRRIPSGFRPGPLCGGLAVVSVVLFPLSEMFDYGAREGWRMEVARVSGGYPGDTIKGLIAALKLRRQMSLRGRECDNVAVKSRDGELADGQREIHILVLGESARASSFQLNGYERETTPLLSRRPGLLNFSNVIAPAPATVLSVPVLLTPSTAASVKNAGRLPSSLNVFKAAGYRVYWLSTQPKHGIWDTSNSLFAGDAHQARFLSSILPRHETLDYQTALDSELLPEVREILARGERKVLLVLHTMGSHLVYTDRYPPEFNRFPADPAACERDRRKTVSTNERNLNMRNAYDNTILFTDWLLNEFIGVLAAEHTVSTLYYVSDHGENGGDAAVLPFAHGNLTTEGLHVPLILWLSPEFQEAHPQQSEALRSHLNLPLSSDTTFHTMLDLAGLTCSFLQPDRSLASPSYRQAPRLVTHMHDGLADYDRDILPSEGRRGGWRPLKIRNPEKTLMPTGSR